MAGLWSDLKIAYLNPAWFQFAEENGVEKAFFNNYLGKDYLDCVADPLHYFYESRLRTCLESGNVWHHDYECSSARVYRRYHQACYPLIKNQGILMVNSLVTSTPHTRQIHMPTEEAYLSSDGTINQCAHCRKVQHARDKLRWDWVPSWVTSPPPQKSQSLCEDCFSHYWPKQ